MIQDRAILTMADQ